MIQSCMIFNHNKHGWEITGITNLAISMLNRPNALVEVYDDEFTMDAWGTTPLHKIARLSVRHGFMDGLLQTRWILSKTMPGDNFQYIVVEDHDMNKENFIAWLWQNKHRLLVTCDLVGWDSDEKKFVDYSK